MPTELNLETIKAKMLEMPNKQVETKETLVNTLKPAILEMRKKGYNFTEIAKLLTENGLKISGSTLKNYIQTKGKRTSPVRRQKKETDDKK